MRRLLAGAALVVVALTGCITVQMPAEEETTTTEETPSYSPEEQDEIAALIGLSRMWEELNSIQRSVTCRHYREKPDRIASEFVSGTGGVLKRQDVKDFFDEECQR